MDDKKIPSAHQWLDKLREIKGFSSDSECAEYLDVSKQAVSHWRVENHQIGVHDCINIARAIGEEPLFLIVCSQYHSANSEMREKYEYLAQQIIRERENVSPHPLPPFQQDEE